MPGRTRTSGDEEIVTETGNGKVVAEVMRVPFSITDEQFAAIDNFDDAMRLATEMQGHDLIIGKGVRVMDARAKALSVDLPIALLEWHFLMSDGTRTDGVPKEYVEILCATRNEDGSMDRWKMSDGSTGIYKQLREYTDRTGVTGGVYVPAGMRVSVYAIDPRTRQPMTKAEQDGYDKARVKYEFARTYYIDL